MTKKTVGAVVTSYVYNIEDRLIEVWDGEVSAGSLTASYYYDPFGRRLWKDVSGVKTYYHYADEGLVGEYDSSGNEIKSYGYQPDSTWGTDPLFMKVGTAYYFYHNDHLGTPQKMTASNGAVVWSAKYESFGEAVVDPESTVVNNLRFPGQYFDGETGLHYNLFRFYDPGVGRYLRADPIGFLGGRNFYSYVHENPITYFDYYGLRPEYIWEWVPGWETFIKPMGYMYDMRYEFKEEYERRMRFCKKKYNTDACGSKLTKSNYETCVDYYYIFKYYSEEYGYWQATFNSMFWTPEENFERLKEKWRPEEHDIFNYTDDDSMN